MINLIAVILETFVAIIEGIFKFIDFRKDRKGRIIIKLQYFDEYGFFDSTKKPYIIITITNFGKSIRQIFKPTIKCQFGVVFYEFGKSNVEYPYKLEYGDQLVIEFDFEIILEQLLERNRAQKNIGSKQTDKYKIYSEVEDTLGVTYKSNQLQFKGFTLE